MIKFVLGHEIGHHIASDVQSEVPNCEQQKREARADEYGFEVLSRVGGWPNVVLPLLGMFAVSEGFSANDTMSTHPAAIKRMLKAIAATRKLYAAHPQMVKETFQGHEKEFISNLDLMEAGLRKELSAAKDTNTTSTCSD